MKTIGENELIKNWEKAKQKEYDWLDDENRYPKDGIGKIFTSDLFFDMKHTGFMLARYKFVAKILSRVEDLKVLEVGCSEGIGALMLEQNTHLEKYVGIDMDPEAVLWAIQNIKSERLQFLKDNFLDANLEGEFDAVYSLDVIEHIDPSTEMQFLRKCHNLLVKDGSLIIGTPSIMMSPYASEASKSAHINLYDQDRLYTSLRRFFYNVYIFNMNDEVVNIGFDKMACYIIGIACNKRELTNV